MLTHADSLIGFKCSQQTSAATQASSHACFPSSTREAQPSRQIFVETFLKSHWRQKRSSLSCKHALHQLLRAPHSHESNFARVFMADLQTLNGFFKQAVDSSSFKERRL